MPIQILCLFLVYLNGSPLLLYDLQIFSFILWISISLLYPLRHRGFSFDKLYFSSVACAIDVLRKHTLSQATKIYCKFLSKSFIVSTFKSTFMFCFELICLCGVRSGLFMFVSHGSPVILVPSFRNDCFLL